MFLMRVRKQVTMNLYLPIFISVFMFSSEPTTESHIHVQSIHIGKYHFVTFLEQSYYLLTVPLGLIIIWNSV